MAEWGVRYDHRFNALILTDGSGPPAHIRVSDILRNMAPHELRATLQEIQVPFMPEVGIEDLRQQAIREADVTGKVVLDVGGYDGVMAKLALDLGAARAICLDNHQYEHYGWAEKKLEGVEYVQGDFMALGLGHTGDYLGSPEEANMRGLPQPDVIIFFNVLYHLKNPWAGLAKLREIIKPDGEMLLCSLHRFHDGPWMYVYNPREANPEDETVYFGPSLTAIERLLTHTGWQYQQVGVALDRCVYRCKPTDGWQRKHEDS